MLTIREFIASDIEQSVIIFHKLSLFYLGDNASDLEAIRRNLLNNILGKSSGIKLFLAFKQSQVVALATVATLYPAPKETGQLFIKELFVDPDYQGQGIGKQFMRFLAAYAIDNNCSRLDWTADRDNHQAMSFYQDLNATELTDKAYFRMDGHKLAKLAEEDV